MDVLSYIKAKKAKEKAESVQSQVDNSVVNDGKNLFNPNAITEGYYADWATGELVAHFNYRVSDYIPVSPETSYAVNKETRSVVFYDRNKEFIGSVENVLGGSSFSTPVNTQFLRVDLAITVVSDVFTFQLEEGTTSTSYERNFYLKPQFIKDNSFDGGRVLKRNTINEDATTFFIKSDKNLLNPDKLQEHYEIDPTNGNVIFNDGHAFETSEYIPVSESASYVANIRIRFIAFYDSNENFISSIDVLQSANTSFSSPVGSAFMRVTLYMDDDKSTAQIEQGTTPTDYEQYFTFPANYLPPNSVSSSKWQGKTWTTLGDSITAPGTYQGIIQGKTGISTINNHGVAGMPMADSAKGGGTTTTGKSLSYVGVDLVTIFAGTNDFKLDIPLGSLGQIGDTTFDVTTYYGAYRDLIEYILTDNPQTRIMLWTPLQRDNDGYDVNFTNPAGHMLIDYVNAVKEVGAMYALPVLDLYSVSTITKLTLATYTKDGLHPNDLGHERLSEIATPFLNNH